MKTLLLMRHAKSDWGGSMPDKERPLNQRGRIAAPLMGVWLNEMGYRADVALVSNAVRARETWERLSPMIEAPADVQLRDDLYHASVNAIVGALNDVGDAECVLLIAHNPGLEELVSRYSRLCAMPTGAIARFETGANWGELSLSDLTFFEVTVPKSVV